MLNSLKNVWYLTLKDVTVCNINITEALQGTKSFNTLKQSWKRPNIKGKSYTRMKNNLIYNNIIDKRDLQKNQAMLARVLLKGKLCDGPGRPAQRLSAQMF